MLSDRFQKQVIFSGLFKVIKENLPIIYYLLKAVIKIIFGTFYFSMHFTFRCILLFDGREKNLSKLSNRASRNNKR